MDDYYSKFNNKIWLGYFSFNPYSWTKRYNEKSYDTKYVIHYDPVIINMLCRIFEVDPDDTNATEIDMGRMGSKVTDKDWYGCKKCETPKLIPIHMPKKCGCGGDVLPCDTCPAELLVKCDYAPETRCSRFPYFNKRRRKPKYVYD